MTKVDGIKDAIAKNPEAFPDTTELETLKPWHALGIAMHEVYGLTYKEVAEKIRGGKGKSTLAKAAQSPAGQRYLTEIRELAGSPKDVVRMLLESTTLQMYVDWLTALEGAKKANDHKLVHQMIKDVGLQPVLESAKKDVGPKTIVINMQGGGPEDVTESIEPVETSWEIVESDD